MPVTLDPASSEVRNMVAERIASGHYPDLEEAEVTINCLFATSDDPEKPAVKLHGEPCAAIVKINPPKDRVEGKKDATITIDRLRWENEWSDAQKEALIDHELAHLLVRRHKPTKTDPEEYILTDDRGRPKLKMRLHDVSVGWFLDIAKRHGRASFEVSQAATIRDEFGQLLWGWGDDNAPAPSVPDVRLIG